MKTIKQIADEIGVSKQSVRNQIAKLGIQSSLRKNANQFVIDEDHESAIKQAFVKKSQNENVKQTQTETQSNLQFSLRLLEQEIEFLRGQIKIKDEQLERADRRLAEANSAMQAAQILHADTKKMLLSEHKDNNINSSDLPKKNFFSRIFKRK